MQARLRVALLMVGMLIAVCCSKGTAAVDKTINSTDKRISVVSVNALPTSIGPVVVGEVRNASNGPVEGVQVGVSLTDKAGKSIGDQVGFTLLHILPPGAKAPFSIPYTGGRRDVSKVSATVMAEPKVASSFEVVQVTNKAGTTLGNDYEVTGTVTNSSSTPVNFANTVVTFYDKGGAVVGAAHDVSDATPIAPGGTTSFTVLLQEQGGSVATYSLEAEAQVVTPGH